MPIFHTSSPSKPRPPRAAANCMPSRRFLRVARVIFSLSQCNQWINESMGEEPAQSRQILAVFVTIVTLGRFQAHRQPPEPPVVEQQAERFQAEKPFADVLMPIHPAPEIFFGVVEMKGDQ